MTPPPTDRIGAWARTREGRGGGCQRTRGGSQRPTTLGGHALVRHRGGWRCTVCRCWSKHWHRMAPQRCEGSATVRWANRAVELAAAGSSQDGRGHDRYAYGDFVWCASCGAYAERFAVGLARPCPGRPLYDSRAAQLRRLQQGRHPLTGVAFGVSADPEHPRADSCSTRYPLPPRPTRETWGSFPEPRTGTALLEVLLFRPQFPSRRRGSLDRNVVWKTCAVG